MTATNVLTPLRPPPPSPTPTTPLPGADPTLLLVLLLLCDCHVLASVKQEAFFACLVATLAAMSLMSTAYMQTSGV